MGNLLWESCEESGGDCSEAEVAPLISDLTKVLMGEESNIAYDDSYIGLKVLLFDCDKDGDRYLIRQIYRLLIQHQDYSHIANNVFFDISRWLFIFCSQVDESRVKMFIDKVITSKLNIEALADKEEIIRRLYENVYNNNEVDFVRFFEEQLGDSSFLCRSFFAGG